MYEFLKIENSKEFENLMQNHAKDVINLLFDRGYDFGIMAHADMIEFNPKLPKELELKQKVVFFILANYTLESAKLDGNHLVFEAGFGADDFATTLRIPLTALIQIILNEKPIFINFIEKNSDQIKLEKSKNIFKR